MVHRSSRRRFLRTSGRVAAGVAAGIAATPALLRAGAPPSERIVLSVIGSGGRGSTLARDFVARGDIDVAHACDADLGRARSLAGALGAQPGKAPAAMADYRRALDDQGVDAVIVATPDHWHALATIHACQAGKDVYVEKPASWSIQEGRRMVEAARKYDRVVQVGIQNRSAPYVQEAVEYVRSGKLGKVHLARVCNLKDGGPFRIGPDSSPPDGVDYDAWLGPAPSRAFNAGHFHGGWYYFFAYCGGDTGNDSSHQLDIARWLLGKTAPRTVYSTGGKLAFQDDRDVPDTQLATFEFDDDLVLSFELTQWAPYMDKIAGDVREGDLFPYWPQCATRIELYGTKGLMMLARHGGGWQVFEGSAPLKSRPGKVVAQRFGRIPDVPHKEDFIQSIRTRKRPNADIEEGHLSANLSHLANISCRLGGRKLVFDAAAERFVGDDDANRLLGRPGRAPWLIPDAV